MRGGLKQLVVLWLCRSRAPSCLGWGVTLPRWKRSTRLLVRGRSLQAAATTTTTSTVTFESDVLPSRMRRTPTEQRLSSTPAFSQDPLTRISIQRSNVTSPRAWLEAQPDGTYTVLRCDYVNRGLVDGMGAAASATTTAQSDASEWKVWGLEFHMERLFESYPLFLQLEEQRKGVDVSQNDDEEFVVVETYLLQRARNVTLDMIRLQLCTNELTLGHVSSSFDRHFLATYMLTVLWTPRTDNATYATPGFIRPGGAFVTVTTHMSRVSSSSSARATHFPAPIRAVLALQGELEKPSPMQVYNRTHGMHHDQHPNRFPYPQAKLSSWCRERRPLEEQFQHWSDKSMGEVILCHADSSNNAVELLEGLTTNLFVLYKDGTLRTAPRNQCLNGYIRNSVLKLLAQRLEVRVVERAPMLDECHMWEEVFVTSSIRLVIPVQSVHVKKCIGDVTLVWESKNSARALHDGHEPSGGGSLSESVYKLLLHATLE